MCDVVAGKVVQTLKMPERIRATTTTGTYASCMAFTPDGRRLATGHTDGTILLWELDLPAAQPARLSAQEIEVLWADLQDADAARAWRAVWRLAESPDEAVPYVRGKVKPYVGAPADVTGPLLADLGSDVFTKREAASKRLKDLGHQAEPALSQRLKANPPLEERQRIEALLKLLVETPVPLTPEGLRDVRAVAVLSCIGSSQARLLLEELSRGVEAAPLTAAARAALGR